MKFLSFLSVVRFGRGILYRSCRYFRVVGVVGVVGMSELVLKAMQIF